MKKNDTYDWAIVLKEINQPIGSITAIEVNEKAEKVHIGYCIGKNIGIWVLLRKRLKR